MLAGCDQSPNLECRNNDQEGYKYFQYLFTPFRREPTPFPLHLINFFKRAQRLVMGIYNNPNQKD